MLRKIYIELDKTEGEALEFFKNKKFEIQINLIFGKKALYTAIWKNIENSKKFKLILTNQNDIDNWWGLGTIKPSNLKDKSTMIVRIYPPILYLVFFGIILLGILYAIISFGIHNFGSVGFWPSLIIPFAVVVCVLLFWKIVLNKQIKKFEMGMKQALE